MRLSELKKHLSEEKYTELLAHVKMLQAKGKGPDQIATSLARKFPELAPALIRLGWLSVIRPRMPKPDR